MKYTVDDHVEGSDSNSQEAGCEFPRYEIRFLDVKDADCIVIMYQKDKDTGRKIVLVDSGNVSDSAKIKQFLVKEFNTTVIDLAICSHPDCDHKGGFFGLLEDSSITVREFWWKNPYRYITDEDFSRMKKASSKKDACECVYNHPTDATKNLFGLALAKKNPDGSKCDCYSVKCGCKHDEIPLAVIGPTEKYYTEAAVGIVQDFAELKVDPDTTKYDEKDEVSEEEAKSVIDAEPEKSYTNMGSLVLLFEPRTNMRFLLTGDASSASLRDIYDSREGDIAGCILKVPHHGSKHNLNSKIIDDLNPSASIISAAGTRKHPNVAIVRYLSKYGNVYSTHKSGDLFYTSWPHNRSAEPLKKKMQ